jgi:hypothetical protein
MILLRFTKLTIWVLVGVVTLNGSQDLFAQTAAPGPSPRAFQADDASHGNTVKPLPADWSPVLALRPGAHILVRSAGKSGMTRYFLAATPHELVVLNMNRLSAHVAVQDALLASVRRDNRVILGARSSSSYMRLTHRVRIENGAIYSGGSVVARLDDVLDRYDAAESAVQRWSNRSLQ